MTWLNKRVGSDGRREDLGDANEIAAVQGPSLVSRLCKARLRSRKHQLQSEGLIGARSQALLLWPNLAASPRRTLFCSLQPSPPPEHCAAQGEPGYNHTAAGPWQTPLRIRTRGASNPRSLFHAKGGSRKAPYRSAILTILSPHTWVL